MVVGERPALGAVSPATASDPRRAHVAIAKSVRRRIKWHAAAVKVTGLPEGRFHYRVERQIAPTPFVVPGEPIRYVVPTFCKFCDR